MYGFHTHLVQDSLTPPIYLVIPVSSLPFTFLQKSTDIFRSNPFHHITIIAPLTRTNDLAKQLPFDQVCSKIIATFDESLQTTEGILYASMARRHQCRMTASREILTCMASEMAQRIRMSSSCSLVASFLSPCAAECAAPPMLGSLRPQPHPSLQSTALSRPACVDRRFLVGFALICYHPLSPA